MSEKLSTVQFNYICPPRAHQTGVVGEVVVLPMSTTAGVLSLVALLQQAVGTATPNQQRHGVLDNYITLYAVGATAGIIFGPTLASVTGANAPVLATTGTVNGSGIYTAAAGTCHQIPIAGAERRYHPQYPSDQYMGFVGSAAGSLIVYQSSPANP